MEEEEDEAWGGGGEGLLIRMILDSFRIIWTTWI